MDLQVLEKEIRKTGYIPRRSDLLGLAGTLILVCKKSGSKAMVIMGPPGTGKSAFAAAAAVALESTLVVYQCHSWSDADELFVGVDVCAAVAGDAEAVRQDGVLAKVAKLSQKGGVVLLLDELDKTMERTEALLLDWLQSGRVPIQPGVHLQTNLDNVLVIATSNEQRELTEAGTRRFCRVVMNPLDVKTQVALIHQRSCVDLGVCKLLWKVARYIAHHEGNNSLSIQEGIRLVSAAYLVEETADDVRILLSQWAARVQKGRDLIANHDDTVVTQSNAAWSEICRARKECTNGSHSL
jgi:MoxR-like ATPase